MKINFDEKGNLTPYELIECDWNTLHEIFVLNFPKTSRRDELISELNIFLESIKILINSNIEIWIDGSFTTMKQNPNDIDIVIFIPKN